MANQNILAPPSGYNTYVGARYVPIFDGEWSSTKKYEPLVVVTYQGNSYTSRTWVPAGIPVSNTTYWALSGNYNAQMEQYRNEVLQYKTIVQQMQIKNVIIIGDSYANGTTATANQWTKSYALILEELFPEIKFFRKSIGGYGFATSNGNFLSLLNSVENEIPVPDEINMILVLGGCNDTYYNTTQIENGMSAFAQYAHKIYQNARICIGCIGHFTMSRQTFISSVVMKAYKKAPNYGMEYITDSEYLCASPWYIDSDYTHPNQNGQNSIAYGLFNFIKCGNVEILNSEYSTILTGNDNFTINDVVRVIAINAGRTTRWGLYNTSNNNIVVSFTPKTDIVFNQYYSIGTYPLYSNQLEQHYLMFQSAPCVLNIVKNDNYQMQVPGTLNFSAGGVTVLLYATTGSVPLQGRDIRRIEIRNGSFSVDSCIGI